MDIRGCSVTVGVDLSSANDLTAVVVVHSDADLGFRMSVPSSGCPPMA